MNTHALEQAPHHPGRRRRAVRSFVRREGRMTEGQRRALNAYWPRYGVDYQESTLDLDALFGRSAPRILEIGFGMGEALVEMARAHPHNDYIGIEVYRPGVGRLLRALVEQDLDNVRIISADAMTVLDMMIPEGSLDAVYLLFPDPWPKKRHHKRRLVQRDFIALLVSRLRPGGVLHMATDWEGYAAHMLEVLEGNGALENAAGPGRYAPGPGERPLTKFERRGVRLGHKVRDLVFAKRRGEKD